MSVQGQLIKFEMSWKGWRIVKIGEAWRSLGFYVASVDVSECLFTRLSTIYVIGLTSSIPSFLSTILNVEFDYQVRHPRQ